MFVFSWNKVEKAG